jgi:YD repeat-containing protein
VTETRQPAAGPSAEEPGASFSFEFGKAGTGNTFFKGPDGVAVNAAGDVYVLDTGNDCVKEYNAAGTFIRKFGSAGSELPDLEDPRGIALDPSGDVWVADTGNNTVKEFSATGKYITELDTVMKEPQGVAVDSEGNVWVADTGENSISEFKYLVNNEYDRVTSFGKAGSGSEQVKEPQGIAVGSEGHVYIADTGNNRIDEYSYTNKIGAKPTFVRTFGSEGTGSGQLKAPHVIATDSVGNVWVSDPGNNRIDTFNGAGTFLESFGKEGSTEGKLSKPQGVGLDSEGDVWVADTGNSRVQEWTQHGSGYGGTGKATSTQTIYYSVAANTTHANCGEHAEWANLPCQTQPAAQPAGGLPPVPVTTYTYNLWDEPETTTSTSGASTRTTTQTYEASGRPEATKFTASAGASIPAVRDEYSPESGVLTVQRTTEGPTEKITSTLNTLGQLVGYTDATGNEASYKYDIDGRLEAYNDGKGTQTYSYSPTSGDPTTLKDSAAGTFTATYDANNQQTSETYPNGMVASYTRDSTGAEVSVEYIKTTHCSSSCTWFSDSIVSTAQGHWASQTSTLGTEAYTEDEDGRLTQVQDTETGGKGCVTRIYAYDADTNRTSLTTREPGTEGKCATEGGTTEKHTYDEADRLNDANVTYNPFGDITVLPAADAGGAELTNSYYVDNQLASQTQNGETIGYELDPAGRTSETIATGAKAATTINHYSGPGDEPAWTTTPGGGEWTRNIAGIGGALVATQSNSETPVLQITNLHGDIIGTAYLSETATKLASTADTTEYGVPTTSLPPKYSWLGAFQVPTELPSGVMTLGARSYVPQLGRFLQPDPVPGGAASSYTPTPTPTATR